MTRNTITDGDGNAHFGYGYLLKSDVVDDLIAQHNEHAAALDAIDEGEVSVPTNQYASTIFEWNDDWMQGAANLSQSSGWSGALVGSPPYTINLSTGASGLLTVENTGRLGIMALRLGTGATDWAAIMTNSTSVLLDQGTWTFETTLAFPTLSDGSEGYTVLIGFANDHTSLDQSSGAYFLYDQANEAIGGPNTSNLNRWSLWSVFDAGDDASVVASKTAILTDVDVVAVTYPETNIYRVKVMATDTAVTGFINGELVGTIETDIPTGLAGGMGAGIGIIKHTGTTSRRVDIDQTRLSAVLTLPRTPQ